MRSYLGTVALFTTVAAVWLPVSALALYKWVDDDGNVHYSQVKPSDRPVEELKPPATVDTEGARKELDRMQKKSDSYFEERGKLKEERLQAEEERKAKKANCERAREELAGVIAHYRVYVTNEAGERVRQSEEQRQAREKSTHHNIQKFCG